VVNVKSLTPSFFRSSFSPYAELLRAKPRVRNTKLIGGFLSLLARTTTSMEGRGVAIAHRSVIPECYVSGWYSQQLCIGLGAHALL